LRRTLVAESPASNISIKWQYCEHEIFTFGKLSANTTELEVSPLETSPFRLKHRKKLVENRKYVSTSSGPLFKIYKYHIN